MVVPMRMCALTKPSGVTSVEARPPGFSLASMIIHDGPPWNCCYLLVLSDFRMSGTSGLQSGEDVWRHLDQ
jgi:hypothetical protein